MKWFQWTWVRQGWLFFQYDHITEDQICYIFQTKKLYRSVIATSSWWTNYLIWITFLQIISYFNCKSQLHFCVFVEHMMKNCSVLGFFLFTSQYVTFLWPLWLSNEVQFCLFVFCLSSYFTWHKNYQTKETFFRKRKKERNRLKMTKNKG